MGALKLDKRTVLTATLDLASVGHVPLRALVKFNEDGNVTTAEAAA